MNTSPPEHPFAIPLHEQYFIGDPLNNPPPVVVKTPQVVGEDILACS